MIHYHIFFRTLILPPWLTGHWKYQVSILFLLQIGLVCRQRQLHFFLHCFRSSHNHCAAYYTSFMWWLCVALMSAVWPHQKADVESWVRATLLLLAVHICEGETSTAGILYRYFDWKHWNPLLPPPTPPPHCLPPTPLLLGGWIHSAVLLDYVLHAKPQGRDPCWSS